MIINVVWQPLLMYDFVNCCVTTHELIKHKPAVDRVRLVQAHPNSIINPWCACARVTVVVLCVCMSVCLSVCLSVCVCVCVCVCVSTCSNLPYCGIRCQTRDING